MGHKLILPSGNELNITLGSFAESKELCQVLLDECKGLKFNPDVPLDTNLLKDLVCAGFSSKKVDKALEPCLKRVTYKGLKIDASTWEDEDTRADYYIVLYEVIKANILPFLKGLYAQLSPFIDMMKKDPT